LLSRSYALLSRGRDYVAGEGLGPFLVRSVAGTGAVRLAAMAASFVVGVQLARMLGVAGYGYYGLAISVITIASIPGELGISRLVMREVAASSARGDEGELIGVVRWGSRLAGGLSLVVMLLLALAALLVMTRSPVVGACLLAGAPTVPFMVISRINGGVLQGLRHIVRGQIPANLIRPLLFSLALLAAYFLRLRVGPVAATGLSSLTAGAACAVALVWARQRLPSATAAAIARGGRKWIGSSVALALTDGMRVLQSELSILLLGLLAPAAQVGLFRTASVTAITASAVILIVGHVAMPVIVRLHAQGEHQRLQLVVTSAARAQLAGGVLLALPLLVAAGPLLGLVYGHAFEAAANATRILAAGQIVSAAFGPNVALLNMTHHERRVTRAMAIALAVNVPALLVLGHWWGIEGVAVAYVAGLLCWNVIAWRDAKRLLGIETSALLRVPN
jgi:O-antigen/teichoic acid export membrane protein